MLKKCFSLQILMQQQICVVIWQQQTISSMFEIYKRIIILIFSNKFLNEFQFIFSRREISSFPFHFYVYCEARDNGMVCRKRVNGWKDRVLQLIFFGCSYLD